MGKSQIEWTEETWNPATGCTKVSEGCKNCYAERVAKRLHGYGQPKYKNKFEYTEHPDTLELPIYSMRMQHKASWIAYFTQCYI